MSHSGCRGGVKCAVWGPFLSVVTVSGHLPPLSTPVWDGVVLMALALSSLVEALCR